MDRRLHRVLEGSQHQIHRSEGQRRKFCRISCLNVLEIPSNSIQVNEWTEHVHKLGEGLLSNEIDSWMTGVNKNLPDKQKRTIARYSGSAAEFRSQCNDVAAAHYNTLELR